MSTQEVLFTTNVAVFEIQSGVTTERGYGMCSLVGQPGTPPRYKLVCFNDQRQAICTATLTGSNEHSLRFTLQTPEYACFHDDNDTEYSIMFLKSNDVELFLAHMAAAFYGASGQPSHSTVIADFAHQQKRVRGAGNEVLELARRAKVRYAAYEIVRGETSQQLPKITGEKPVDTSGDLPYAFEAVQSAYSLPAEGRGFEHSVLGMIEDTMRAIIVPHTMPRNAPPTSKTLVFIVTLKRVVHDPTADVAGALVEARNTAHSNNSAMRAANALILANDDGPPRPKRTDPRAPGAGVPAEHMLLVQKVASQVNTALSSLRDLHDKIDAFNGEWKQTISRPKPSVLPNNALEQNLRNLINENERARDELTRREELIHAIDERNRDLQRRVDKAAQLAQTLMEEKKKAVSQTGDMRLEMDRQNMRLQEQITQASNERDDVQRHLTTVKKLLDMSDVALQDTKGRFDIVQVQVRGTGDKLDACEEQLGEERTRRKALEAKVAAMQEEIRNALAEAKLKSAELDDVTRKADADRIYHAQLMEDERQRRSIESAQLRSEIVTELQNRETKFQADRARVSADNFERGHEEGLAIGRRNARIDIEHRMQELQLEAQRCKTELDAYKHQLNDTRNDAMADNRQQEAAIATLKRTVEEVTKTKAKNEYTMHSLRLRVKHAEDALLLGLTTATHRLSRTIEPTDLLQVLDAIHAGQNKPDLGFEATRRDTEVADARRRREEWMFDEAATIYEESIRKLYDETVQPMQLAFADLNADIARLWYERDIRDLEGLLAGEASVRGGVEADEGMDYKAIENRRAEEIAAQKAIVAEESRTRPLIAAEYDDFAADLMSLIVEQACARQGVVIEAEAYYASLAQEEDQLYTQELSAFERVIFEKVIQEQELVMSDEEHARIALVDDEQSAADQLRRDAAEEASAIRDLIAEREKELRAARDELEGEEARKRLVFEIDEEGEHDAVTQEFESTKPKPPTPPPRDPTPPPPRDPTPPARDPTPPRRSPTPPQSPPAQIAVPPPLTDQSDEASTPVAAATTGSSPAHTAPKRPPQQTRFGESESDVSAPTSARRVAPPPMPKKTAARPLSADSDDEQPAQQAPRPATLKPPHQIPFEKAISNPLGEELGAKAMAASDSDSDKESGFLSKRPAPKAAPKRAPAASQSKAAATLFDSEDEASVPTIVPTRPAAKVVAAKAFGSDSEGENGATPRPKPAAKPASKPAAKPAPKKATLFDESD
jgi:hypothetical protein